MYNVTSSTDIEMYVHAALGEFESKLERLLFVRESEGSIPVKYDLAQFPGINAQVITKKKDCVNQYRNDLNRLNNLGTGKRQPVTIGLYLQKLELYRKMFQNRLDQLLEDVEKKLTTELHGLKAA